MNIAKAHIGEEEKAIWQLLAEVSDPEVPVLSVIDLGIIRNLHVTQPGGVEIIITPTYSGCPAMDMISMNIRMALLQYGYKDIKITTVLSPAWTTAWMTSEGKQKLKAYGIAPPGDKKNSGVNLFEEPVRVQCPQCNSYNTVLISEFGSTSCKSLRRCTDCGEAFDHFKCH